MNLKKLMWLKAATAKSEEIELYDAELYPITNGRFIDADGSANWTATTAATLNYIPCEVAAGKKISLNKRPAGTNNPCIAFYTDSSTSSFISAEKNNGSYADPWVVDVPATAKYVRFSTLKDATDLSLKVVS